MGKSEKSRERRKKSRKVGVVKKCPFCGGTKDWRWVKINSWREKLEYICCRSVENRREKELIYFHRFSREPVAFGYDKETGQPLALDKHGNRFDPTETRYAKYPNDRFGWKATGKIPPKRTYHFFS